MDIAAQLRQLGLNHSEIRIYLDILENGHSTPPNVSRRTKIARTNCYNILRTLTDKELIVEQEMQGRKQYLARDPESLLRGLERKRELVKNLLPELRGLYAIQKNKPKVRYYDGVEQIQEIYRSSLSAKEIFAIASTKQFMHLMPDFYDFYNNELKNRGIVFRDILTAESRATGAPEMKAVLRGLYSAHFFEQQAGALVTDLLMWDDNVALLTLREPVFGTLITNRDIAGSFMVVHRILWQATT